ncbi:MAG: DUF2933 domain-containing protein [Pseudomonadota bacterium]
MIGKDTTEKKSIFNGQRLALVLFIIIGGFFLWTEHQAHVLGALPYLILLLCPLMHFFMHRGHGQSHDGHQNHEKIEK